MEIKLHLKISPNKPQDLWLGPVEGGRYGVALAAVAKEGQANSALIKFLAHHFHLPPSKIKLLKGATSRFKTVTLTLDPLEKHSHPFPLV